MTAGVRTDMTLAHARALLPIDQVHIEEYDPQRDHDALLALAHWAIRFSPIVAVDPADDGLMVDITGCQRVFNGERTLINRLISAVNKLGFHVRVASAPTYGCAWAVARYGHDDQSEIHDEQSAIEPLPIAALRVDNDIIESLNEVGVQTIGQLVQLPRQQLPSRFGDDLLLRLDQALGLAMEQFEPIRPNPKPRVERVFAGPTKQFEAIHITVQQLLTQLATQLHARESGVRKLKATFERVDAPPEGVTISLSRPSRDVKHLWSLLFPKVEQVNLGYGVERVELHAASIGRLQHTQTAHWRSEQTKQAEIERELGQLLDTIASRIGADHVTRVDVNETYIPERAFEHRSALQPAPPSDTPGITCIDRPSVLLAHPEPVHVIAQPPHHPHWLRWRGDEHRIVKAFGPERIDNEWWREERHGGTKARRHEEEIVMSGRDYFKLQDGRGQWMWVFRDSRSEKWFVHGQWT